MSSVDSLGYTFFHQPEAERYRIPLTLLVLRNNLHDRPLHLQYRHSQTAKRKIRADWRWRG